MSREEISSNSPVAHNPFTARQEQEARQFFRAVFEDGREAHDVATEFIRLSRALAANPNRSGTTPTPERFYQHIVNDPATGQARSRAAQAVAVHATLDEMREQNLAARSSPQARRAHLEIDSYRATDDLPRLLETPEGRTRAEHAAYLHGVNPEARDLYERGAVVVGQSVIIPRDANSAPAAAEQVRMGSLAHAVRAFTPLVGDATAREKAAEFVALGRDIAGRTADGDARLVVFQEFYRQVQRDEQGRWLPAPEQAAQLEVVLNEMRPLAAAMRAQEWTREDAEIVSLDEWEQGRETRQRDTEHESAGRLTYQMGETLEPEVDDARAAPEREATAPQLEELLQAHGTASVSYERLSFAGQPPRYPDPLTRAEALRLRYEVVPYLDRQLENGVPPAALINQLARRDAHQARAEQTAQVTKLLTERAPEANQDHPLTRAEEARALYTLQALGVPEATVALQQRGFSAHERAAALDTVGGRLAQDYRAQVGQLKTFAALEQERAALARAADAYRDQQRATPGFQARLAEVRAQETNGKQPTLRGPLAALLVNPELARAQAENAQRRDQMARSLSRVAGTEITDSASARAALTPGLRRMRTVLDGLAAERATLDLPRTTRPGERQPTPLYVAVPAQSGLRLAVGDANEYRLITATAEKAGLRLHTAASLHGPPLTADSPARAAELNFAREYVQYRLTDETTRLRNTNPLFREFATRLDQARTPAELRQTVKEIRQENYARARDPERFAGADAEARAYGLPPRHPLNGAQMKQLLLAEAPAHYNAEMRAVRRDASLSARDKQQRIQGLATGQLQPSPALQTLLTEFGRTQTRQPLQTTRNIKAFLSDYLNPPTPERNRFSRHNLYELRQQLGPAERDYLYQVIEQARQATLDAPARQHATRAQEERATASRHAPPSQELTRSTPNETRAAPTAPAKPDLRATLEERISAYLVAVVNTHGVTTLASPREGVEHAAQVSRIVKETFREQGVAPATYRLTDERLAAVAGQLVGGLPHALQQAQQKQLEALRARPAMPEIVSLAPATRTLVAAGPHAETVRGATHNALDTLVASKPEGQKQEGLKRDEPVPPWQQPPTPGTPLLPRAQEVAAAQRQQPDTRYVLRR